MEKIEVVREGRVRRAKLYYLRTKQGKEAKIAEREYVPELIEKGLSAEAEPEPETVKAEKS
jgi:large subunit ribosomal protein L19